MGEHDNFYSNFFSVWKKDYWRIFPIFSVACLRYFGILAIHPILYGDVGTDYSDDDHRSQQCLTPQQFDRT